MLTIATSNMQQITSIDEHNKRVTTAMAKVSVWFAATLYLWLLGCSEAFCSTGTCRREKSSLYSAVDSPYSVVIVGGGWAGFSAADAIAASKEDVQIHLLDASPRGPGGLAGGWRTPNLNRTVEAGLHGFWREYRNTFDTIEKRIGLDIDSVLTPFTPSTLVSSNGRVAVAPVLGDDENTRGTKSPSMTSVVASMGDPNRLAEEIAPLLPPPLDVALLTEFDEQSRLSIQDRITGIGLLGAWADFGQEDRESWLRYDDVTAENLFRSVAAVSPQLYDEVVLPLLHVLPMCPGYDCSAAAALSCFHVFALQTKGAFDVRWCRGTITEKIFNPWAENLQRDGGVDIQGASRVTGIDSNVEGGKPYRVSINNGENEIDCDAVILAVGATTAGRIVESCPPLQSVSGLSNQWKQLRGITCVAVRLFVDKANGMKFTSSMIESPVVVCGPGVGNIPTLVETGFCVYDLSRLQDEFSAHGDKDDMAFEVDFFRADYLADMEDDEILQVALDAMSTALGLEPYLSSNDLADSSVFRARKAVSHFCVGSAKLSPPVRLKKGLYVCGDWVDRVGHASWSTVSSLC